MGKYTPKLGVPWELERLMDANMLILTPYLVHCYAKKSPPKKFNIDTQKAPSDLASMLSAHIRSLSQATTDLAAWVPQKKICPFLASKHLAPLESGCAENRKKSM